MMARFVAITPDQLATIKDNPETVEGVFALDAGVSFEGPADLQERARALGGSCPILGTARPASDHSCDAADPATADGLHRPKRETQRHHSCRGNREPFGYLTIGNLLVTCQAKLEACAPAL